ncbi:helix-turn-helix transcriptional regulator [Natronomonas sp.]|uniref:helix-turn-helix transcriptional regulator n=1 Tax=Natronomonas sp. TaxID=2184060 RepID=UPI00260FF8E2|nr:hypothetical protein [Natronomonas sp.]
MRYRVPLLLCALLVCLVAVGPPPAAAQPQAGETHLDAQLLENGDARWNVTVAIAIEEGERADFEAFAERFEAGEERLGFGVEAFERAAAESAAASGRDMEIRSVRREAEIVEPSDEGAADAVGVLRVRFRWASFARVEEDGTLIVDDTFNTSEGTWLPGLTADQSLTIRAPPGYAGPTTSPIGADGGDLRWEGPETFEPGYFTIVYPPGTTAPGTNVTLPTVLVAGALVLSGSALVLGLYLLAARRRTDDDGDAPAAGTAGEGRSDADLDPGADPGSAPDADRGSDPDLDADAVGDTRRSGADASAADPPPEEADAEPDLELLSDEERVEYLLERNGGRMKQATIVKETGWSNAKVSQLLSAMDDNDRVDKLRIGRENLISLPGEGVGDIDPGSDDA